MDFIQHRNLQGLHAPFSASQSHWLRYDDEKVMDVYLNKKAAAMGSRLHEWAKETIDLGLKQDTRKKTTLNMYINDAIGFKMSTEVVLFYSERLSKSSPTVICGLSIPSIIVLRKFLCICLICSSVESLVRYI